MSIRLIKVTKEWIDADESLRPDCIIVQLLANGEPYRGLSLAKKQDDMLDSVSKVKLTGSDYVIRGIGYVFISLFAIASIFPFLIILGTSFETEENIIAIIGDGSMSGGEALEGLDTAGEMDTNLIIVFNDNDQSIAEVHGGMYKGFRELRETKGQSERNLFKAMGLEYRFVEAGNDAEALIAAFSEVKDIDHPVVIHIVTQKGKGYKLAEENKEDWHWHMPFDIETGEARQEMVDPYAEQTAATFLRLAKEDEKFIAISAATPSSMGLTQERRRALGKHYLDVGIAEEQAVAMASGLARNCAHPVFGDFSSFFQRTYDQLSQDVCVNNNPATFLVFWASMYGMNDVTHLGFYDIPMMSNIPNLVYLAPPCWIGQFRRRSIPWPFVSPMPWWAVPSVPCVNPMMNSISMKW